MDEAREPVELTEGCCKPPRGQRPAEITALDSETPCPTQVLQICVSVVQILLIFLNSFPFCDQSLQAIFKFSLSTLLALSTMFIHLKVVWENLSPQNRVKYTKEMKNYSIFIVRTLKQKSTSSQSQNSWQNSTKLLFSDFRLNIFFSNISFLCFSRKLG